MPARGRWRTMARAQATNHTPSRMANCPPTYSTGPSQRTEPFAWLTPACPATCRSVTQSFFQFQ